MAKTKKGRGRQSSAGETTQQMPTDDASPRPPEALAASSECDVVKDEGASAEIEAKTFLAEAKAAAEPAGIPGQAAQKPTGRAWGQPLVRFDTRWTFFESRLIALVLVGQLLALVLWVVLNGLGLPKPASEDTDSKDMGMVFRILFGALSFALVGWFSTRGRPLNVRRIAATAGIVLGGLSVPLWRDVGVEYFDNVKRWLQEGSTLTLLGGLRGLGTRLTLWLALLGASLATAAGKHIHIDVIFRFLPIKLRLPATVVNFAAAVVMCVAAAWGFVDHIAIESFGATADDRMLSERADPSSSGERRPSKVGRIWHHMGLHAFLTTKQVGLDIRSLPHVLAGDPYDRWMPPEEWNRWVKDAGFEAHYPAEQVSALSVPADSPPHTAMVIAPDGETTRGMLVHDLNLIFPFGMLMIALRFLLRIGLVVSGHIDLDPDAAHKEEIRELEHQAPADEKTSGGLS